MDEYYTSSRRREQRRLSTTRIHIPESHHASQGGVRYQYEDRVPEAHTTQRRSSRRTPLFRVTSAPTTGASRGSRQHHYHKVRTQRTAPTEEDRIRARLQAPEELEGEHLRNAQRRYERYSGRQAPQPAEGEDETGPGIEVHREIVEDAPPEPGFSGESRPREKSRERPEILFEGRSPGRSSTGSEVRFYDRPHVSPHGGIWVEREPDLENHEIPHIRVKRRPKNEAQEEAKAEARRDVRSSVRRATSNFKQFNDGDPRKYMEQKYGVILDASEKTLHDVELETAFRSALKKEPSALERLSTATKLETLLFSEPLTLSDSEGDDASDEEVQQILNVVMRGDNLHIPDRPYKPQAEVLRDKRPDEEDGDDERAQSLREREHSICEREVSIEEREASLRARMAAFEERERRARERDIARRQQRRQPQRAESRYEPPEGYRQLPQPQHRQSRQSYYVSDEGSDFDGSEIGDFDATSRR